MPVLPFIKFFSDLRITDIPEVGGKNASLGEMYALLLKDGIRVPNGFAVTSTAYRYFLEKNNLTEIIKKYTQNLDVKNVRALQGAGLAIRRAFLAADLPTDLKVEVIEAYRRLSKEAKKKNLSVAVRSSATAEDLPDASFAGQQETYLNIRSEKELLKSVRSCFASLFTDRAISYREAHGFDHLSVSLSVGVQRLVRSDLGSSGVMFTIDTETGHSGFVLINASYGLGEYVVKGRVTPDQFYVFKDGLRRGLPSVVSRTLGRKDDKLVIKSGGSGTRNARVSPSDKLKFSLTDSEVLALARWGIQIEDHYGRAQDIEWAKDGETGELFIVQARPETVKARRNTDVVETFSLKKRGRVLLSGTAVGQRIGSGKVRIISQPKDMINFQKGEVMVARLTDPDWEPAMRLASAIITEEGGKTSHAAIVSRELGVPAIVGAAHARTILKTGQIVTVSCAEGEEGRVFLGKLPFKKTEEKFSSVQETKTKVYMNVGDPDQALELSMHPADGVGLAREEFIFTNFIKIHPLALINFDKLKDKQAKQLIAKATKHYKNKSDFVVDRLAEGFGKIAAAFFPRPVIIRFSDFKTNEYARLLGGAEFEPKEENPMIGWRGASRYYEGPYRAGFALECQALKKAREEWGLHNLSVMVPFCRTPEEGEKVLKVMAQNGLSKGKNGLKIYMMCEIPSNVILADKFLDLFDGFSIGSNDLTQLTLGIDRDAGALAHIGNEENQAVKELIARAISAAKKRGKYIGICGQAPSDHPDFAAFLVNLGIDSISLNPDSVIVGRARIATAEKNRKNSSGFGKLGFLKSLFGFHF